MRLVLRFAVIPLLLFCLAIPAVAAKTPPPADAVARVGSVLINTANVDLRAQKLLPLQGNFHGGVSSEKIAEIRAQALDELIERAYKVQYAIDGELSVDSAVFEAEWQKKFGGNKQLAAPEQGALVGRLRADLYLDLLAARAEEAAVGSHVKVTDAQVSDYYAKNKSRYLRPKQFTASHVFVKVDPSANAEEIKKLKARADELFKRAKSGEDFYNLAYYESDDRSRYVGGSLGTFHAGQTVPEFDAAIRAMKAGEIAGPVRTMYGFHIIKLDALDEERQLKFDEVAAKIRASMVEEERAKLYGQWLSGLKKKYLLERLDKK